MDRKYTYKYFLELDHFIEWQLYRTKESTEYWIKYLESHPDRKEELDKAIHIFSHISRRKHSLSSVEKQNLFNSILKSSMYKRRYTNRIVTISLATAAILAFAIFSYFISGKSKVIQDSIDLFSYVADYSNDNILLINTGQIIELNEASVIQFNNKGIITVNSKDRTDVIHVTPNSQNRLIIPYGQRTVLMLEDSTKLWLNSGTDICFPTSFASNSRKIEVTGELFADVTSNKNNPFIVSTTHFDVKVTGTRFNISNYLDNSVSNVVLVDGRVEVLSSDKVLNKLLPNEKFSFKENESQAVEQVDVREYVSWKDGYLFTNKMSVVDLLATVSRHHNIEFKDLSDVDIHSKTCSGKFVLDDDLDIVIESLSILLKTKIQKQNRIYYLLNQ